MSYLIVGLGNPGEKYTFTRHNLGFLVLQKMADAAGAKLKNKTLGHVGKGQTNGTSIVFLMPTTYMNESGRAVRHYSDFFKISHENVVIIVDDVDLPFGTMRLRVRGGSGGHNGLKNIEQHLGTQNYPRLRLGIGCKNETMSQDTADYVLAKFTSKEIEMLPKVIDEAISVLRMYLCEDPERAIEKASLFHLVIKE